jgi:hypothetical protein
VAFTRIALGWAVVVAWLSLWELLARRLEAGVAAKGRPPVAAWVTVGEALWLTLLAGLWFASLGHGGWARLFLLLGLSTEWTARLHGGPRALSPGQRAVLLAVGVTRTVISGGLLTWILW